MSLLGSGSYHMTGRFARPLASSSSKPGAGEPKCQKCLQTGHWTYECKGQAAYQSRPSASKQLMNPAKRKYLNPEEVPEWMRYNKKELEEKQKQEAEARRKQRKKKHKADSSSSGSDTTSSSSSGTTSSSTSGSSGSTTSSSTSDTSSSSSSSETSSSSDTSSSSSSGSSDSDRKGPPHKRARHAAPPMAAEVDRQQHRRVDERPGAWDRLQSDVRGQDSYRQQLVAVEEVVRGGSRQRGRPSPDSSRPDGRVDGRAAAAAGGDDRAGRRSIRDVRQDRSDDRQSPSRSASPPAAAAHHGRRTSSPGRWAGDDERLERQTSGAWQAEQRLAAPGGQGRHVRSQVADRYRGDHRDMGFDRDDRHQPTDSRELRYDSHRGRGVLHVGAVQNGRHIHPGQRYDRDRHRSPARRQDYSPHHRGHEQNDGYRDSRPHRHEAADRQRDRVRHDPVPYRDRYTAGEERRARSPAADRQNDARPGRARSPSRSRSRSLSRSTGSGSSSGTSSQGTASSGSDSSSRSHSSSSGRSSGSRGRKPLRRGGAADSAR